MAPPHPAPTNTFLTAEWRKLIMAQYKVSPAVLAPYLPAGTTLDLFDSGDGAHCYVSVVGFIFDRVRVKGLPIPFHTRFEEVNLRFYVRRTEADGSVKRGVVFVREFVPRLAITVIANVLYEEPYATLPMRHNVTQSPTTLQVEYGWRHHGRWYTLAVQASPTPQSIAPGSEAEFITEHYWGYTRRTSGATSQYEVRHPRWLTYSVQRFRIEVDFATLYGPAFAPLNHQQPASILLAEGSPVSVHSGTRLQTS